jgi:hypothetical protein
MKKVLFSMLAVLVTLALVFPVAVLADDVIADADGVAPVDITNVNIAFGNIPLGDSASQNVLLAIERTSKATGGGAHPELVFNNSATVTVSVSGKSGTGSGAVGTSMTDASIVLPSDWTSTDWNSKTMSSDTANCTVTVNTTGLTVGTTYNVQVTFQATGASYKPGTSLTVEDQVNVHWTVIEGQGGPADTEAPTVIITVSDSMISEADAGGTFDVIATFSEAMNTTVTPVISFAPDVELSGTLTFSSDAWSEGDTVYTATYDIADVDEEVTGVDVSVGGAKDLAGNLQDPDPTTEADLFDVDTVAPVINIYAPVGTYLLNEPVDADWDVTDYGSGVNWSATYGDLNDGAPVDTSVVGQYSFYVYAEDNAGNSAQLTALYGVVYNFGEFLPPLVINGQGNGLFKAGSTIPVKFQLTDYYGNPVSTASGTASINTSPAASAPIRYDVYTQQYIANLKTPKGVTGAYIVTVNLDDGTSPTIGVTLR